jgi:hypothetical protein
MIKNIDMGRAGATTALRVRMITVAAGICLGAAFVAYAVVDGPRRYTATERADVAADEAESLGVCERLGIPSSADGYAACASELAGVRQQREERVQRRMNGIL